MANRLTNDVAVFGDAVTAIGTTQLYPLGTLREEEGESYRYVQRNDATVTISAGDLVYRGPTVSSAGAWVICADVSDTAAGNAVGIAMGAIANSGYGWIKTRGYYSGAKKMNGTALFSWGAVGVPLVAAPSATSDGKIKTIITAAATKVSRAELIAALGRVVGYVAAVATNSAQSGAIWVDLE